MDTLLSGAPSSDDLQEIRRAISAELAARGLREDDEPTPYGLQLEALIDKLGVAEDWPVRPEG